MNAGVLFAVGAYLLWGLLPLYWKTLAAVPAHEILGHRMVWSLIFAVVVLALRRRWTWARPALRSPRTLVVFAATGTIIAANWFTYIWAVNHDFLVEASLGYFINPLFTVLLGMIFLGERLRPAQWGSIALAGAGVLYLTFVYGSFPWVSLVLAATFGMYGLIRKTAPLGAIEGLALETAVLFVPASVYLVLLDRSGTASFGHAGTGTSVLLALTGPVTAVPLMLFAAGARRITMTSLGLLHYVAPTLQLLLGVFLYGEPFTTAKLVGFTAVWLALALYTVEGIRTRRAGRKRNRAAPLPEPPR